MTTDGLKYWIIAVAVLLMALVLFATSGGSVTFDFSLAGLVSLGVILVAAWRWGGWRRS
jgi:hypothetical protein